MLQWFSQMLGVEFCMLTSRPAFCLLTWLAAFGALYGLLTVQMQVSLVARETTLVNVPLIFFFFSYLSHSFYFCAGHQEAL